MTSRHGPSEELASGLDDLDLGVGLILVPLNVARGAVSLGREPRPNRPIQRVEATTALLGQDILERKPAPQRAETPEETTHRRSDKGAKHAPVVGVQALGDDEQVARLLRVAVVEDETKEKNGEDAAQPAGDDLEAAPPVEAVDQTEHEDGDDGGGDEVGDKVDLQNRGGFKGDDDGGEDDEHHAGADPPDVEAVAEEVV